MVGKVIVVRGVVEEGKSKDSISVAEVRHSRASTVFVSHAFPSKQNEESEKRTFGLSFDSSDTPRRPQATDTSLQLADFSNSSPAHLENSNSAELPHHNNILTKHIHTSDST